MKRNMTDGLLSHLTVKRLELMKKIKVMTIFGTRPEDNKAGSSYQRNAIPHGISDECLRNGTAPANARLGSGRFFYRTGL